MRYGKRIRLLMMIFFIWLFGFCNSLTAFTLEEIKQRGLIQCGVVSSIRGFASSLADGKWEGFDVDFCRSVAAAVFGDADKVRLVPVTDETGIVSLQSGAIDLLASAAWSRKRDVALGVAFVEPLIAGEQGFLARDDYKYKSVLEARNITLCTVDDSHYRNNLEYYLRQAINDSGRDIRILNYPDMGQAATAFSNGRCELLFGFKPHLAGLAVALSSPDKYGVLEETVSRELRGPVVRKGDSCWYDIVRWVRYGLVMAEDFGVGRENIDTSFRVDEPGIKNLFHHNRYSASIGLAGDWLYQVVSQVGNYGELWERNIGTKTPLQLDRGENKIWKNGGVFFYPLPDSLL